MSKRVKLLSALGLNVRKQREAKELTQEKLAEKAGLDPTYISGWFVELFLSFANEGVDVLNECSDRALATDFADAAFVVTSNCSGNNFH